MDVADQGLSLKSGITMYRYLFVAFMFIGISTNISRASDTIYNGSGGQVVVRIYCKNCKDFSHINGKATKIKLNHNFHIDNSHHEGWYKIIAKDDTNTEVAEWFYIYSGVQNKFSISAIAPMKGPQIGIHRSDDYENPK